MSPADLAFRQAVQLATSQPVGQDVPGLLDWLRPASLLLTVITAHSILRMVLIVGAVLEPTDRVVMSLLLLLEKGQRCGWK